MAVEDILRSSAIQLQPFVELIDYDGQLVLDITDHLETDGSYISRDSTGFVAGTADFQFDTIEDINFNQNLLAAGVTLVDHKTEETASWRMGNWVMSTPVQDLDETNIHSVECTDIISFLSYQLDQSFQIAAGTNVGTAIGQLLGLHGLAGLSLSIPPISLALANSLSWSIDEDRTYLELAKEILDVASHVGLFSTRLGTITTYPWQDVDSIPISWNFDETNATNWIAAETELEPENDAVPNIWLGIATDNRSEVAGQVVKIVNDNPESPYSITNQRGRKITRKIRSKATTFADLTAEVQRAARTDILQTQKVRIKCGPVPLLWNSDVVNVNIPRLGLINRRGIVREWNMPFDIGENDCEYLVEIGR